MVEIMLTLVFKFYLSFSLVKVLCNGPQDNSPPYRYWSRSVVLLGGSGPGGELS